MLTDANNVEYVVRETALPLHSNQPLGAVVVTTPEDTVCVTVPANICREATGIASATKAVVAICVVFVPGLGVGARGVPVREMEVASFADVTAFAASSAGPTDPAAAIDPVISQIVPDHVHVRAPEVKVSFTEGEAGKDKATVNLQSPSTQCLSLKIHRFRHLHLL